MNTVILDARSRQAYEAGHRVGALHADLETQLSNPGDPAKGGRHPLPPLDRWLKQVAEWGITPESYVIVYDDQHGANAAARVWWMLRAIGVRAACNGHTRGRRCGLAFTARELRASRRLKLTSKALQAFELAARLPSGGAGSPG